MSLLFNPRLIVMILMALPLVGGATVDPQGAMAFVLGAWVGVLIGGPVVYLTCFVLGLIDLRQLLAPLVRLPVLVALSGVVLWLSGAEMGLGLQALGAAAALWWVKRGGALA